MLIKVVKKIKKQLQRRLKKCACLSFLLLVSLSGCVTGGKTIPESATVNVPIHEGSTLTLFDDGRRGFVLTESANLDAATRRNFDQAVILINNRDFEQAIALLEPVVETSPGVTAPYINLAMVYRKVDKSKLAEEQLKTALNLIPAHPVASNEYGLLLRKAGRFDEARNVYEQALMTFPDYLPVRRNLGILCDLYLNDPECALAQYELYNEVNPENKQVKMWITELQFRLGK